MNIDALIAAARDRVHRKIDATVAAEQARHVKSWRRRLGQIHKRKGTEHGTVGRA